MVVNLCIVEFPLLFSFSLKSIDFDKFIWIRGNLTEVIKKWVGMVYLEISLLYICVYKVSMKYGKFVKELHLKAFLSCCLYEIKYAGM